ncbi:hypothetical protein CA13_31410 [Planctomycetes bacterium CA13]|uniref:Uncharacterized protein n=1 Tax=Novipirellula herctigrandis TaxID=2527986 RepID=A0A5C5Z2X8_9BACT|nr:hypothetical protein CA13_31410 [Planctomycetes bacterium CA13]
MPVMISTSNPLQAAANMVFTQGRGFVVGKSFGLPCLFASVTHFGLPCRGHRLFGNVVFFW